MRGYSLGKKVECVLIVTIGQQKLMSSFSSALLRNLMQEIFIAHYATTCI